MWFAAELISLQTYFKAEGKHSGVLFKALSKYNMLPAVFIAFKSIITSSGVAFHDHPLSIRPRATDYSISFYLL